MELEKNYFEAAEKRLEKANIPEDKGLFEPEKIITKLKKIDIIKERDEFEKEVLELVPAKFRVKKLPKT